MNDYDPSDHLGECIKKMTLHEYMKNPYHWENCAVIIHTVFPGILEAWIYNYKPL